MAWIGIGTTNPGNVTTNGNVAANGNVTANGSVGIGTSLPTVKLDIYGNNDYSATLFLSGGSDKWAAHRIGTNEIKGTLAAAGGAAQFADDAVAGDIILRTESSSQKLFLNSGTTSALVVTRFRPNF